jgi:hypothetical protein
MKTPAIVASLTVAGSIAFAAGQQSSGKQSSAMPGGAKAQSMQEEMPQAKMQMTGGCTQGADKNWFTMVHPLPADCDFPVLFSAVDINGDGMLEFMRQGGGAIVVCGQDQPEACLVSVSDVDTAGGNTAITNSCVATTAAVAAYAHSTFPSVTYISAYSRGFRDMDGDGDLDLVTEILVNPSPSCDSTIGTTIHLVWIENAGFQHTNHVAADLNGDGQVNGADLGLLLVAWGPNP